MLDGQKIPLDQRLAPRYTEGTKLDLTAATLFVQNTEMHARLCNLYVDTDVRVKYRGADINPGAVLKMLLNTLHSLHTFWRQKKRS